MTAFVSFVLPLAFSVHVSGSADCPSRAAVQAALDSMANSAATSDRQLRVDVTDGAVTVTVTGAEGDVLAQKPLPVSYACGERAQAAAVFATTWDVATSLSSPLADVVVPAVADVDTTASARPLPVSRPQELPQPPTARMGVGGMAVAGSSFDNGTQGLGIAAELVVRPAPEWGIRGDVFGLFPRTFTVGAGEARWRRTGVSAGLQGRLPRLWGAWAADASALLAYTAVQGQGFEVNGKTGAWVPGARLAVGVDLTIDAPWSLGLELAGLLWAADEQAIANTDDKAFGRRLPRADLLLRLTLAFEKRLTRL